MKKIIFKKFADEGTRLALLAKNEPYSAGYSNG